MTEKYNKEKHKQLGMNASTASGRLVKDTLYRLIVSSGNNSCFRCGKEMTRETFSIEHKIPWLHSENPQELFFDQGNITFSHIRCNISSARRIRKGTSKCGTTSKYSLGCRCELCREAAKLHSRKKYTPEKRRQTYLKTGK